MDKPKTSKAQRVLTVYNTKFQTNKSQQLNDLEIVKQSEVIRFELTNYILVLLKSN